MPYLLVQKREFVPMMPHTAGDNRRMDVQLPRQQLGRLRELGEPRRAFHPDYLWNEHFTSQGIGFFFSGVFGRPLIEIVKEIRAKRRVQMNVREFMHQREPEIIQPVMPHRQPDDWTILVDENCGTIKMSVRKVRLYD